MIKQKLTTGANDRPTDETIAQSGSGLPDDSSNPVEVTDEEAARLEELIRGMGNSKALGPDVPLDVEDRRVPATVSPEAKLKKEVQEEIDLPLKGSA